jgi:agmatinase
MGAPVPGGLSSREALSILRGLGSLDLKGFDVVEVSPPYDHANITALAGATLGALLSRRARGAQSRRGSDLFLSTVQYRKNSVQGCTAL